MNKSLHWGLIGCGNVVEKKSGPSILQSGGSRIVAVMRRDAAKAKSFADKNNIALCTEDASEVIENKDVDIVYVATPPSSHKEYVLAAAAAQKHVLVEKPMGLSAADDREMIDACRFAGVELFVAYYRRFHPHVLKMKELIDGGSIGRPLQGQIDFAMPPLPGYDWGWRIKPEISGGGLFVDMVSHRIDLMVYLLGEPAETHGLRAETNPASSAEEVISLSTRFKSGAVCSISGNFASPRKADRFLIAGTKGVLCAESLDSQTFTFTTEENTKEYPFQRDPAPHKGLIQHIEKVVFGQVDNQCSGHAGLYTDLILDGGLKTAAKT